MGRKKITQVTLTDQDSPILNIHSLTQITSEQQVKKYVYELEQKCTTLGQTIQQLMEKIQVKEEEIAHLHKLLNNNFSSDGLIAIHMTDEELIADIQLRKLKEQAQSRDLNLDEIKKFDLLVKNKRLAQGNATVIESQKTHLQALSKSELIQIASRPIIKKDQKED